MTENYYHILGLDNFASQEEIKSAYRQLAKKYHPDKNPNKPNAEDVFKRVNQAYKLLSNPQRKAAFDQRLKHRITSPAVSPTVYTTRRRYYTTEKRKFTPTAWMYGRIFIICLITTVVLVPLILFYQSSIIAYKKGLEAYKHGHAYEALNDFNRAMTLFGGRSVEAGIKGAEISIYDLKNNKQGHYFINRGLKYAEKQKDYGRLHFLMAKAYQGQRKYKKALKALKVADSLHYAPDSIQLESGLLLAFSLNRYKEAKKNFDYLIQNNIHPQTAWFGKAWCLQNLGDNKKAIAGYSQVIDIDSSHALAYYYRGINRIMLSDTLAGCRDFQKSRALGYSKAAELIDYHCKK